MNVFNELWFRVKVFCEETSTFTYFDVLAVSPAEAMERAEAENPGIKSASATLSKYQ